VPLTTFGSPPSGLRFARCFARFAPPGGSRKNLALRAKRQLMEIILFCGIQASGKSTFYKEKFFNTHVRISMDLLNTRNKETKFLDLSFQTQSKIVIDNTNPTKIEREKYISLAKKFKYKVICYYFISTLEVSLIRNENRTGKEKIPEIGIKNTIKKLEIPSLDEGIDELYRVEINNNHFKINKHEI
jgi:predicted kinase